MAETESHEKETSRIEAFSDGVFAIALTLLAIDLKAPVLETINNPNLAHALVERWAEYCAFVNSFAAVLLMWTTHHQIFRMVQRSLILPLPIYAAVTLLAFVNPWITVSITTALWIYWAATLKEE